MRSSSKSTSPVCMDLGKLDQILSRSPSAQLVLYTTALSQCRSAIIFYGVQRCSLPLPWAPLSVGSPLGAFKKGTSFVCHPTVRPVCTTDPRLRTTHPSSIPRPVACADSIRARSLQACVIPRNAIAAGPTRRFYTQGTAEPAAQRRLVGTPEQGSTKHGLHNNTALLRDSLHFRQFGPPWVF